MNDLGLGSTLAAHKAEIMAKPYVCGIGIGYKIRDGEVTSTPSITVLVSRKMAVEDLFYEHAIQPEYAGIQTDVIEVGHLRALAIDRTSRVRPAPGGVSIGHYAITAGTLGCVMAKDGEPYILSNNHVLANQNDALIGDPIYQPGVFDGGGPADEIAQLAAFVPIDFGEAAPTCPIAQTVETVANGLAQMARSSHRMLAIKETPAVNLVDAALAFVPDAGNVTGEILEFGEVWGSKDPEIADQVVKSGRTTGFNGGSVLVIEATVQVDYGPNGLALFEHQCVAGPMSAPGDSGSLVIHPDSHAAAGLLFAGSDQATIFSPASLVESALGFTF